MINLRIDTKIPYEKNTHVFTLIGMLRAFSHGKKFATIIVFQNHSDVKVVYSVNMFHEDVHHEIMNRICTFIIKEFHPKQIIFESNHKNMNSIVICHQFNLVNHQFIRHVDELEWRLAKNSFDEYGYIIHQGNLKDLVFGNYSTSEKGCGWIASYNLLKLCNQEQSIFKIKNDFEKQAMFRAKFGLNILNVYDYLRQYHLNLELKFISLKQLQKLCDQYDAGILLYRHQKNNHFVCYKKTTNQRFQFYNAVYGKRNHISTMEDFIQQHIRFPIVGCIFVKF